MADKIKLGYNDEYEPTDSEDDLDAEERELIDNVRKKRVADDPKREILRFDESEDDDVKDLVADSDIEEGNEYDGIPDEKAWGKKRSAFYHTDFVDQDYSTYTEKEEELAQQEEEEAKAIQQRLAKQLDEADFTLDIYAADTQSEPADLDTSKTKLKKDFSQLSARQKQQLFQKDSPEFPGLIQDFQKYTDESESILSPILKYAEENNVKLPIFDFIQTRHNLILTYCTNIGFYLVLKSKRVSVKNHPIVKRLVQLRQLIIQLDDTFESAVKPQLEEILQALNSGQEFTVRSLSQHKPVEVKKKKRLSILKTGEKRKSTALAASSNKESDDSDYDSQEISPDNELMDTSDEELENAEMDEGAEGEGDAEEGDERRGITYQIAKNKGLTPSRKKENRNPRVKHRNKFRKALIRRKGAVRTVRKEITRYGGEMSGIKANVRKGIKFKS